MTEPGEMLAVEVAMWVVAVPLGAPAIVVVAAMAVVPAGSAEVEAAAAVVARVESEGAAMAVAATGEAAVTRGGAACAVRARRSRPRLTRAGPPAAARTFETPHHLNLPCLASRHCHRGRL